MQLFPMQKIIGIGKHSFNTYPSDEKIKVSDIGWAATAICCQVYGKTFATAPILASCTYYSILKYEKVVDELIGYNPYINLSDLEKAIVEYCVTLAILHELDCEVRKGNFHCIVPLEEISAQADHWNKKIAELSKEKPAEKKLEKKKEYKH